MKQTKYSIAKNILLGISRDAKSEHRGDKPMIRMIINDSCDQICRGYLGHGDLTDCQQNLLHRYACTLHPKDKAQRRSESYHASLLYGIDNQ